MRLWKCSCERVTVQFVKHTILWPHSSVPTQERAPWLWISPLQEWVIQMMNFWGTLESRESQMWTFSKQCVCGSSMSQATWQVDVVWGWSAEWWCWGAQRLPVGSFLPGKEEGAGCAPHWSPAPLPTPPTLTGPPHAVRDEAELGE